MKRVIVISAHPDDEVIGAGGTLLKHKAKGDEIYWLITTNISENHGFSKERGPYLGFIGLGWGGF